MTDRNSVRDILYRAGAEGQPLAVKRAFSSPAQGVSVILKQLENGVLPRCFHLDFDSGAKVDLDVAERQVLGLRAVSPAKGAEAQMDPGPVGLEDAKRLGDLLAGTCRGAKSVRISSSADEGIVPGGSGLTLDALRKTAALPDVVAKAAGTTTWLDAFVDHASIDVLSAVLIDVDEAHVIIGSKDEAEALADWAVEMLDVVLADGFPLAPELETKGAVTFAPQKNGSHILLAGLRGQFLLALISGPDAAATLSIWKGITDREIDGFLAVS